MKPSYLNKPDTTYLQNGLSFDVTRSKTPYGMGVPVPPMCNYTIVPTLSAANSISPAAPPIATVPLTLDQVNMTMFRNERVYVLDCARCIEFVPAIDFADTVVFTVRGYDINYKLITSNVTIDSGNPASTDKAFLMILSITPDDTSISLVGVNASNSFFGLPFLIRSASDVISFNWDNAIVAVNITSVIAGHDWRSTGVVDADSADANGIVQTPTDANGTRALSIFYYCYGADSALNAQIQNESLGAFPYAITNEAGTRIQVCDAALDYTQIRKNVSNTNYVYSTLIEQDLIGPGFPADSEFLAEYIAAINT